MCKYTMVFRVLEAEVGLEILKETRKISQKGADVILRMSRRKGENVVKTLKRLQLNMLKRLENSVENPHNKSMNNKLILGNYSVFSPTGEAINLNSSDEQINEDFWKTGMQLKLFSLSKTFNIVVNPPTLAKLGLFMDGKFPIFVGIPITAKPSTLFATDCVFEWRIDEKIIDSRPFCVLDEGHLGKYLNVTVIPFRKYGSHFEYGDSIKYYFPNPIERPPRLPMLDLRKEFISSKDQEDIRVVSYNILADAYVSHPAQGSRYSYCESEDLHYSRRLQLLLLEILAMKADLILLQEVDEKLFYSFLQPALQHYKFHSFYSGKATSSNRFQEGCVMALSSNRFVIGEDLNCRTIKVGDLLDQNFGSDNTWQNDELNALLRKIPALGRIISNKIGTVLQVVMVRLKGKSGVKQILLANSHLYYHPYADHIRAIQMYRILQVLDNLRDGGPLIFGGDFNSDPASGAMQLVLARTLRRTHPDCWKYLRSLNWEGELRLDNEPIRCDIPELELAESFPEVIVASGIPSFTHFVPGFIATLDYILVSKPDRLSPCGFQVRRAAPVPQLKDVKSYLPNSNYPSDHILVAADISIEENSFSKD